MTPVAVGVPLLVDARSARVCCVGGGTVAARKLTALLDGGASVRIVAPTLVDALRTAVDGGRARWVARPYDTGDIGDAHLVIAATASAEVNARVAVDADGAGRLCVRVDRGGHANAAFMATVRRDPLVIGVSTSGAAPALARTVRGDLADRYGPEWGEAAALFGALRDDPAVHAALAGLDDDARRARWRAVADLDILTLIRAGTPERAKEAAYACLLSSSD